MWCLWQAKWLLSTNKLFDQTNKKQNKTKQKQKQTNTKFGTGVKKNPFNLQKFGLPVKNAFFFLFIEHQACYRHHYRSLGEMGIHTCKSHSPPWSQIGQSNGWLTNKNSITPSLLKYKSSTLYCVSTWTYLHYLCCCWVITKYYGNHQRSVLDCW